MGAGAPALPPTRAEQDKGVPALLTKLNGLGPQELHLHVGRFPPVFLEELPGKLPTDFVITGSAEVACQIGERHRLIRASHSCRDHLTD
jgi:hypothetical protein